MTATGLDMRCNKASECRGGQRGFGEEAMRLLMEQKKTKRFGGKRARIYCPVEEHIYSGRRVGGGGGVEERGGEIRQVGL